MIYLEMAGRLGNQMFRYAFAKRIQELSNKQLIIDFKRVYDSGNKNEGWDNSLKLFNTDNYKEVNGEKNKYFYKNASLFQLFLYFAFSFISRFRLFSIKLSRASAVLNLQWDVATQIFTP